MTGHRNNPIFIEKSSRISLLLPPTVAAVFVPLLLFFPFSALVEAVGLSQGTANIIAIFFLIFMWSYVLMGVFFYKAPLKIFKDGIGLSISPYERIVGKRRAFIPYAEIVAICPAHGLGPGFEQYGILELSGVSIRTTSNEVYYLTSSHVARNIMFSYEVIWALKSVLGERLNKLYDRHPEFSGKDWEDAFEKMNRWDYRVVNYVSLIAVIATVSIIPVLVMLIPRYVHIVLFLSVLAFWMMSTIFFMPLAIWKKMEEYGNFVGTVSSLQERDVFTGEKIIPQTVRIPEHYRYADESYLSMSKDEWSEYFEKHFPAKRTQRLLRSLNPLMMTEKVKLARLVRAERVYKTRVVPSEFDSLVEEILTSLDKQFKSSRGKPRLRTLKKSLDKEFERTGKIPDKPYKGYHAFSKRSG